MGYYYIEIQTPSRDLTVSFPAETKTGARLKAIRWGEKCRLMDFEVGRIYETRELTGQPRNIQERDECLSKEKT